MDFINEFEKTLNINILITNIKLQALKSVLSEDQLLAYNEIISNEEGNIRHALGSILPEEEVLQILKNLNV